MSRAVRPYLVLATQRSGSTLLVESLRATGCAGEPQEFFQYLPSTGMAPSPGSGSLGSTMTRSCNCSIRWTPVHRTPRRRLPGVSTSAPPVARPTASGAAS